MATNTEEKPGTDTNTEEMPGTKTNDDFTEIQEGKAKILFPTENSVFYNKVQVFNRDLSISVIKYFIQLFQHTSNKKPATEKDYEELKYIPGVVNEEENDTSEENGTSNSKEIETKNESYQDNQTKNNSRKEVSIMEALSATGLRAIRYALEIPSVYRIIANDLSKQAVTNIDRNIKYNGVEKIVESANEDASMLLYQNRFPPSKRFQIVDLDPYGSPCQFLDGAIQAIDDGGLLCVTCTDMGALCGNHGEAAFAKYGSMPYRAKYCHEMALRIVLACLDSHAGRYRRYIQPLVSLSADFYIRVFVRVFTSASEVKRSASKKSYVYHCNGCEMFTLQPVGVNVENGDSKKYKAGVGPTVPQRCKECGHTFKIGGPIWSERIHDLDFVNGLIASIQADGKESYNTYERMIGVLTLMNEELADRPLYLVLDNLCNILHCSTPSKPQFYSALIHAGYKVSGCHANVAGFKTDAPQSVIWDILRCWCKTTSVKDRKNALHSPATALLSKTSQIEACFDILPEATPHSKIMKLSRYPLNPEVDWGPKARAKQTNRFPNLADKRKELQGKRRRDQPKQDLKQFLCKRFKRGECQFSDTCRFSHDKDTTKTKSENKEEEKTPKTDSQNTEMEVAS